MIATEKEIAVAQWVDGRLGGLSRLMRLDLIKCAMKACKGWDGVPTAEQFGTLKFEQMVVACGHTFVRTMMNAARWYARAHGPMTRGTLQEVVRRVKLAAVVHAFCTVKNVDVRWLSETTADETIDYGVAAAIVAHVVGGVYVHDEWAKSFCAARDVLRAMYTGRVFSYL